MHVYTVCVYLTTDSMKMIVYLSIIIYCSATLLLCYCFFLIYLPIFFNFIYFIEAVATSWRFDFVRPTRFVFLPLSPCRSLLQLLRSAPARSAVGP